jgi:hypothetical protein
VGLDDAAVLCTWVDNWVRGQKTLPKIVSVPGLHSRKMSAVQLDGETPGEGTEVEAQALRSDNVYWVDYRSGK